MMYSRASLVFILKLLGAKSIWSLAPEKIQKKRKLMKKTGLLTIGKTMNGVRIEEKAYKGYPYYVISATQEDESTAFFYSHGGGYIYDITYFHWEFLQDLCKRTGISIVVPIYPLAPEHTKEESFPWIYGLYSEIQLENRIENWILMGDSAGGGLSLAIALKN